MGLVFGVDLGDVDGVVGEEGHPLEPGRAERTDDGGVEVGGPLVRGVELVDDPGLLVKALDAVEGDLVFRHGGQVVAPARVVRHQAGRIPLEGAAFHLGIVEGLGVLEIVADVVEDRLLAARAAHRRDHAVHEGGGLLGRRAVGGFVVDLEAHDHRVVLGLVSGVGVVVVEEVADVVLLDDGGVRVAGGDGLVHAAGESGQVLAGLGIAVIAAHDHREHDVDAALLEPGDEVVEQVEVLVGEEVALAVGDLVVPDVDAVGVDSHACEVVGVLVDGLLDVGAEAVELAVGVGERRRVVDAEPGAFLAGLRVADDALAVDLEGLGRGGEECRQERQQDEDADFSHGWVIWLGESYEKNQIFADTNSTNNLNP